MNTYGLRLIQKMCRVSCSVAGGRKLLLVVMSGGPKYSLGFPFFSVFLILTQSVSWKSGFCLLRKMCILYLISERNLIQISPFSPSTASPAEFWAPSAGGWLASLCGPFSIEADTHHAGVPGTWGRWSASPLAQLVSFPPWPCSHRLGARHSAAGGCVSCHRNLCTCRKHLQNFVLWPHNRKCSQHTVTACQSLHTSFPLPSILELQIPFSRSLLAAALWMFPHARSL